jgi:hypothetical protein
MSIESGKMKELREILQKEYPESPKESWELKRYWEIINLLDRRVCYMGKEGCKNPVEALWTSGIVRNFGNN